MKNSILLASLIILLFACDKNTSKNNYQIDVTINNITDGTKVFLKKQENRTITKLDSTFVENGKFSFKGNIKEPIIFGIFIDSIKRGGVFPFVGINNHVIIEAFKDSLNKSKITGSELHNELTRLREIRDKLTKQTQKFLPEFQKANQDKDSVAIDRINKKVKKISNQMDANDWNYVKSHPDSYITPLVFNGLMTKPKYKDSIKIVFNNFSDKIKNSTLANPIRKYFDFLDKQKEKKSSNTSSKK
jgi:hypothetical protein